MAEQRELLDLVVEQQAALTRRAELVHDLLEGLLEVVVVHHGARRIPSATRRLDNPARRVEAEVEAEDGGPDLRVLT